MNIIAFFTNSGVPATGLTPTIDIWQIGGSQVITGASMTETGGGFYYYNFATYDDTLDYAFRSDGGITMPDTERYVCSSNELGQISDPVNKTLKIEKGKWEIKANQMIFYDDDGVTELYKFDLKDASGNPTMRNVFKRVPA